MPALPPLKKGHKELLLVSLHIFKNICRRRLALVVKVSLSDDVNDYLKNTQPTSKRSIAC